MSFYVFVAFYSEVPNKLARRLFSVLVLSENLFIRDFRDTVYFEVKNGTIRIPIVFGITHAKDVLLNHFLQRMF